VIRVAAFVYGGKVGRYYGHYSILRVSFTYDAPNITARAFPPSLQEIVDYKNTIKKQLTNSLANDRLTTPLL